MDDEIWDFLMKTKQNFENLDIQSSNKACIEDETKEETEDEFWNFLMKTRQNLESLDLQSDSDKDDADVPLNCDKVKTGLSDGEKVYLSDDSQDSDDDDDTAFLKFLEKVKELSVDKNVKSSEDSLYKNSDPTKFDPNQTSPKTKKKSSNLAVKEVEEKFWKENPSKSLPDDVVSFCLNKLEITSSKEFMKRREMYSQQLFHCFNEKIFNHRLPQDMSVTWSDNLRSTAGITHCKSGYWCTIELSTKVLTSFDRLRDTLLHEMCHAAVWIVNKTKCHHGPLWQTWAARCKMILPHIDVPTRCHQYEIDFPFTYKCTKCDWKCGRHSRSIKLSKACCPKCRSSLVLVKNKSK